MPTFEWKGTARNGQVQSGVLVADSKDSVVAMMRRQQIVITAVKEKGKEIAVPRFGGGVPAQMIAIFTRQFSVMIDAGLPLVQCLEILGSQQENKTFRRTLIQIRQDVESGSNLADAMRSEAHRAGERLAIPLAADDEGALKVAIGLVQDAGFEPVVVGGLARAKEFDVGTPVFGRALTARELRKVLGIGS